MVMENEENIAELREKYPDAENEDEQKFELSEGSTSTLEVMKDIDFNISEWIEDSKENTWVIRTVKLWFAFQKAFHDEDWCKFP
jgi:hypothetical protein